MSTHDTRKNTGPTFQPAPSVEFFEGERVTTFVEGEEPNFGAQFSLIQIADSKTEPSLDLNFSEVLTKPERLYALASHARHELANFLEECARRWQRVSERKVEPSYAYELFMAPCPRPRLTLQHDRGHCYEVVDGDSGTESFAMVFDSHLGGFAHACIYCTARGEITFDAETHVCGELGDEEAMQYAERLPLWWADLFKVEAWARNRVEGFRPA